MKNNILNLISLVLVLAFPVLATLFITKLPMQAGFISLAGTYFLYLASYILFYFWKDESSTSMWIVLDIITFIGKLAVSLVGALIVLIEGATFLSSYNAVFSTTVSTTATVQEMVNIKNYNYVIVEYPDQEGTVQRATLSIYGKGAYLKDDKISIRYNTDDKSVVCSDKVTIDSPLCSLNNSDSNPDILS